MAWPPFLRRRAPISCDDAIEAVSAGIDDEQAPVRAGQLRRHLANCGKCRAFAQAWSTPRPELRLISQASIRSARPVPSQLVAAAIGRRPPLYHGSALEQRSRRKLSLAGSSRYLAVVTPALAVAIIVQTGLPGRIHLEPTKQLTPCTEHLSARELGPGRSRQAIAASAPSSISSAGDWSALVGSSSVDAPEASWLRPLSPVGPPSPRRPPPPRPPRASLAIVRTA